MKWTTVESQLVYTSRRLQVRREVRQSQSSGRQHEFHLLEFADWVTVVPITPDRHVVMVRQFRHGISADTLEFPAGILDPEDPSPASAALRELREETGYAASRIEALGVVHPNPATQPNRCHVFVAHDAVLAGAVQWDPTEEIEIERVPMADLPNLARHGAFGNALTVTALHLLSLYENS